MVKVYAQRKQARKGQSTRYSQKKVAAGFLSKGGKGGTEPVSC